MGKFKNIFRHKNGTMFYSEAFMESKIIIARAEGRAEAEKARAEDLEKKKEQYIRLKTEIKSAMLYYGDHIKVFEMIDKTFPDCVGKEKQR